MTVEDQRGSDGGKYVSLDRFPVGMRVLAVDDDPICLKVLENLLRKCQYQVTTTNQAVKALKMLRENRNKFDLVISDVNMPDMDGFKLLELVGLDMELPVIMLSAHSDTKLVMKGVTHGACDYLLKPVRIEELKNIWQHVIRRRKLDTKDHSKSPNHDKACRENGEGGKGVAATGNEDQNVKFNRKRKDQNKDEEEEGEEKGHDNEDPSTQKKPRVVWSPELHKKFVAAVHQLGVDKAFPKKILDLMNVEGLTRENVASHLQKFRGYLKKASMVPAIGGKDTSYMRTGALEGFGDLHSLAGSVRLANTALSSSLTHGRMLRRLNSPAGLTLTGSTSTGLIQLSNPQNLSNSVNNLVKFRSSLSANQNANLFQGIPVSLDVNQLQQTKCPNHLVDISALNNPTGFTVSSGLQDARAAVGSSSMAPNYSSNTLMLPGIALQTHSGGALGNQSSVRVAASDPKAFDLEINDSSNFLDHNHCNESWQGAVQASKFPSTAFPMSGPSNQGQMRCNNLVISSTTSQIGKNPHNFSSASSLPTPLGDSRGDIEGQDGFIGNIVHTANFTARQRWEEHGKENQGLNQNSNAINSFVSANAINSLNQSLDQNNAGCSQSFNASILDKLNGGTLSVFRPSEIGESAADTKIEPSGNYLFEQAKAPDALQDSYGLIDDIISAMMKQGQNETTLMDGEFGLDTCALGSWMQDFTA